MMKPLIGLLYVALTCGQFTEPELSLTKTPGSLEIERPREPIQASRVVNFEYAYALLHKRLTVVRVSLSTGGRDEIRLGRFPEMNALKSHIVSDIDVDTDNAIYIPIVWTDAPRRTSAGVAVFSAAGAHQRTIKLVPPVNIRRFAVHPSGSLFVLGTSGECFKGTTGKCLLVHEYTPDGQRIRSFSEAPALVWPGQSSDPSEHGFEKLFEEADRGQLWIRDGLVYQLLPVSNIIRAYTPDGSLAAETTFLPPGPGTFRIWNAFSVGEGRYLVDWVRLEGSGKEAGRRRGLAVHDRNGTPLTRTYGPQDGLSLPLACRESDDCVVVTRHTDGTLTLSRARLELRLRTP